jgi:phage-related protein
MANSFSFNSVDMSAYGLRLRTHQEPFSQETDAVQLLNILYGMNSVRPGKAISLNVVVYAAALATLLSYLDSIRRALNQRVDEVLAIDTFTDRYWLARFVAMTGSMTTARIWEGQIDFVAHDPASYKTSETSNTTTIDADPHDVSETNGGNEQASPVYTLVCDDTLAATDVIITNTANGQALTWEGDLIPSDVLEIDVERMIVKLNGVEDMTAVSGQFPMLVPGVNLLTVVGYSGTFNIRYRERNV